jgi:hypothetical protein
MSLMESLWATLSVKFTEELNSHSVYSFSMVELSYATVVRFFTDVTGLSEKKFRYYGKAVSFFALTQLKLT